MQGFGYKSITRKPYARKLGWLQSSGTQYFQTDFVPGESTRVVCQLTVVSIGDANFLFGARQSQKVDSFLLCVVGENFRYDFGSAQETLGAVVASETVTVDADRNVISLDGSATTLTAQSAFSTTSPMALYGCNTNGTVTPSVGLRASEWWVYDDNTLVRHYVPVMDKEGVPCLYDEVGRALLYNAGTGTFSYGEVEA